MSEPEKTSVRLKVDDVRNIPGIVDTYLNGSNPPDLVLLQLDSEKFPRRTLDFPEDVRKYVMTHPRVKVEWDEMAFEESDLEFRVQSHWRKPVVYIVSNAQSLSELKSLKDEFSKAFKIHEYDAIVFMNLAVPYFKELDFFRELKCKKYIVHRAGYYRQDFKFNKYFGLDELKSEKKYFNGRFGVHYEYGMKPRLTDLNTNKDVECVDWSFLKKYPDEHTPTTGFIVYFLVRQFFPDYQVRLVNFDGKESNQKFGHKWSFEIKYFNDVDIGHKVELAENTSSVDICYITDKPYVELTQMSIYSAINSKNDNTILNVHVICDKTSEETMKDFRRMSCKNAIVETYDVDSDRFVKDAMSYRHCSKTMYLKIFIPSILSDLDKILYLDGDILVRKDLTGYFSQLDVSENYDMAVIRDLGVIKIWPDSFKTYEVNDVFNSG